MDPVFLFVDDVYINLRAKALILIYWFGLLTLRWNLCSSELTWHWQFKDNTDQKLHKLFTFTGWFIVISVKTETKNENNHFSWPDLPKLKPYNKVKNPATADVTKVRNQARYLTQWGQYESLSDNLTLTSENPRAVSLADESSPSKLVIKLSCPPEKSNCKAFETAEEKYQFQH